MQLLNELIKYDAKTSIKADPLIEVENILKSLELEDKDILTTAGFTGSIASYNDVRDKKDRYEKTKAIIAKYGKENIFKTSSIKKLAINYGLRFLHTTNYKGSIPSELVVKIKEFTQVVPDGKDYLQNSFILAPAEMFNLQPHPKDPLYFVQLTDNQEGEENLFLSCSSMGC